MFWAGADPETSPGIFGDALSREMCFAGGHHDGSQSGHYLMEFGEDAPAAQGGWRFCKGCFGLFFPKPGGAANDVSAQGFCPAKVALFPAPMVHDFSNSGPYHMRFEVPAPAVPDAVTLNSGFIPTDLSLGGSATLAMNRNGDYTFSGHMHDSGALGIEFLITFVVMTPSAIAITVQHSGSCGGTFTSGSRDNDWSESGNNKMISDHWAEVTHGTLLWTAHANDTLTHEIEAALQDALQQALQAAGKAAVQELISLVS